MTTDREFSTAARLPGFPGESIVTRWNLPADHEAATAVELDRMRTIAIDESQHPEVGRACLQCLGSSTSPAGRQAIARALWLWIASHIELKQDAPALFELLGLEDETDFFIRPSRLLTMSKPAEDCDGFSTLACSMLLAAGVPCEFVTIAYDRNAPSRWSHVYCNAILEDGSRFPMDCSHGDFAGWEPPEFFRKKVWPVMTPTNRRSTLHGYTRNVGMGEIDWGKIMETAVGGGIQIAKQVTLPQGTYVQRPGEVMSATGYPPTSTAAFNAMGSVSPNLLLYGGLGLLGFMVVMSMSRR